MIFICYFLLSFYSECVCGFISSDYTFINAVPIHFQRISSSQNSGSLGTNLGTN